MTPAGGNTSGFSFGAAKPAFGATSASGGSLSFGNPSPSAPSFGTSFGAPATSAPAFGTPAPAFGTPAPAFGAPTLAFGAPGSTAPNFGTAFGTPATSAPAFSTGFGTPATTAPPAFGTAFATPNTSAPPAFGTSFTNPSGFGFNTATTSTPSTGLGFGTSTAPVNPALSGFSFGAPTTTSAPSGLSFPFGLSSAPTTQGFGTGINFGKPLTTQADTSKPTAPLGLGGVDSSTALGLGVTPASTQAATSTSNQASNPRLNALPPELALAVDSFKTSIRQRKQISSDIARNSIRPLHKVKADGDAMLVEVSELNARLIEKKKAANNLRTRAAAALPAAERAHRTAEAPHGVEYESGEAIAWIAEVVGEGEERLRLLKRQLEAAQKQLNATPKPITDQELVLGMKRIHDSFVAVAGRLYAIHELVEAQKTQYQALRRNVFKDNSDVFASTNNQHNTLSSSLSSSLWQSKNDGNISSLASSAAIGDPLAALGITRAKASPLGPTPFSLLGSPGFGGINFPPKTPNAPSNTLSNTSWNFSNPGNQSAIGQTLGNVSWLPNNAGDSSGVGLNLQQASPGNKRGKH